MGRTTLQIRFTTATVVQVSQLGDVSCQSLERSDLGGEFVRRVRSWRRVDSGLLLSTPKTMRVARIGTTVRRLVHQPA